MKTFTVKMTSDLPVAPAALWQQVSTLDGVNAELMPLVRMTAPDEMRRMPFTQVPVKQHVFTSRLMLFGLLPVDLHRLCLDEVWEGGFRENSSSLMHRAWRHERIVTANGSGSTITDTLNFEPRLPLVGYVLLPVVRFVFQHRHRRLRKRFGDK